MYSFSNPKHFLSTRLPKVLSDLFLLFKSSSMCWRVCPFPVSLINSWNKYYFGFEISTLTGYLCADQNQLSLFEVLLVFTFVWILMATDNCKAYNPCVIGVGVYRTRLVIGRCPWVTPDRSHRARHMCTGCGKLGGMIPKWWKVLERKSLIEQQGHQSTEHPSGFDKAWSVALWQVWRWIICTPRVTFLPA